MFFSQAVDLYWSPFIAMAADFSHLMISSSPGSSFSSEASGRLSDTDRKDGGEGSVLVDALQRWGEKHPEKLSTIKPGFSEKSRSSSAHCFSEFEQSIRSSPKSSGKSSRKMDKGATVLSNPTVTVLDDQAKTGSLPLHSLRSEDRSRLHRNSDFAETILTTNAPQDTVLSKAISAWEAKHQDKAHSLQRARAKGQIKSMENLGVSTLSPESCLDRDLSLCTAQLRSLPERRGRQSPSLWTYRGSSRSRQSTLTRDTSAEMFDSDDGLLDSKSKSSTLDVSFRPKSRGTSDGRRSTFVSTMRNFLRLSASSSDQTTFGRRASKTSNSYGGQADGGLAAFDGPVTAELLEKVCFSLPLPARLRRGSFLVWVENDIAVECVCTCSLMLMFNGMLMEC